MNIEELIKKQEYHPEYDPYMQLYALKSIVQTLRAQSAKNGDSIKTNEALGCYDNIHPIYGNPYTDDCASTVYFDAFLSSSIAACLTQYIEAVLRHEIYLICFQRKGLCPDKNNPRFKGLELREFWNIGCYYNKRQDKVNHDISQGIVQLLDALDVSKDMPNGFAALIKVLFKYRNNVMHNGVEWPKDLRSKFDNFIIEEGCDSDFEWSSLGNEKWIAYMTDVYIDSLLLFCENLRDVFNTATFEFGDN